MGKDQLSISLKKDLTGRLKENSLILSTYIMATHFTCVCSICQTFRHLLHPQFVSVITW